MNMFEEIEKEKIDLPKTKTIKNQVNKVKLNSYQRLAIIIYVIIFVIGILMGNLFPVCGSSSTLFEGTCTSSQFNTSLMICIWFMGFIICLFIFMLGHIVLLLNDIKKKLDK